MTTPKLPPIQPPQIPNSMRKGLESQEPPKSNFFFILLMTFLIIWTFQAFKKQQPADPVVPLDSEIVELGKAPALSKEAKAELPQEFVAAAERASSDVEPKFVTLGSLDPDSPYRMLVTLTNRGAALTRVELNEPDYEDKSDNTGYLGQIVADESLAWTETELGLKGVAVQVVGNGSPAATSGLKAGDLIVGFTDFQGEYLEVNNLNDLRNALLNTSAGDKIKLSVYSSEELLKSSDYVAFKKVLSKLLARRSSLSRNAFDVETQEGGQSITSTDSSDNSDNKEVLSAEQTVTNDPETKTSNESVAQETLNEEIADNNGLQDENGQVFDLKAKLGDPKVVEVELGKTPLSVLRPSGMVRDYSDYQNLVGLQGSFETNNDALYLLENKEERSASKERKMNSDPLSFLFTLGSVDGDKIGDWAPLPETDKRIANTSSPRARALDKELPGINLRNGYWDYVAEESNEKVAVFRKVLLERQLEIIKRYELASSDSSDRQNSCDSFVKHNSSYHLKLSFETRNYDPKTERSVSYLLDGPTGLPLEGAWFSAGRKTGPGWGAYGLRDVVVSLNEQKSFNVVKCWDIAQDKSTRSDEVKLDFLGVDGQYFQCTAIPANKDKVSKFAFAPIRVGTRVADHMNFTDVSFRIKSDEKHLAPRGQKGDSFVQEYVVFVGPKQRDVIADYGLSKTIVYGWFWFVSIPLLWILHFFHDYLVFNYGIAIVMLTILVRLCLFPLSRKQVVSSLKMQKLQPELATLKEKYKDKPQEMMLAQQNLFKKHGVNPLSGCLPIFIQMPIFIGLYKALSLDVNLYGASLFPAGIRWCSNLAAPDMAFDWSSFWNNIGWTSFNMGGRGFLSMFSLGPYLNILPVITIVLFLVQQKLLVPPVVGDDEQARQQRSMRRMMNFMMIFMGFMFFKVPSGLCIYFIVSSLWGLLERKMTPKSALELNVSSADSSLGAPSSTSTAVRLDAGRDRRRKSSTTGKPYEIYSPKRDKKGRRIYAEQDAQPKTGFRAWWNEVVERAKEQQRLAKAEEEDRIFLNNRKRRR